MLGSARLRRGGRVLSGSVAAAIGEIVKRLADELVVSGISNWPAANLEKETGSTTSLDVYLRLGRLARPSCLCSLSFLLRFYIFFLLLLRAFCIHFLMDSRSPPSAPATSLGVTFVVVYLRHGCDHRDFTHVCLKRRDIAQYRDIEVRP